MGGQFATDLRLLFPVGRVDLSIAVEPQIQLGMGNGVEALVMPTLWLGVGW